MSLTMNDLDRFEVNPLIPFPSFGCSTFCCKTVDTEAGGQMYGYYTAAVGTYWQYDYSLKCYESYHLIFTMVLGVPGRRGPHLPNGPGVQVRRTLRGCPQLGWSAFGRSREGGTNRNQSMLSFSSRAEVWH